MMKIKINSIIALAAILLSAISCENVEDGYHIDYEETDAQFTVELLTPDRGAIGDTISFSLQVKSNAEIQSLVAITSVSGAEGTGYEIDPGANDPLIDHAYGTIQEGINEIDIVYNYIVAQDSLDASIIFTLVDDIGKKEIIKDVYTVPSIVMYDSIVLFTQTSANADGFSTLDGVVYHNLDNYTDITVVNNIIQESIDFVTIVDDDSAMLVAPYNGSFTADFSVRNKTLFKKIDSINNDDFDNLTNGTLSAIVEENNVKKGATSIGDIKVGDFIGFRTDFASANPYHYGILRINAIHPTTVEYYVGTSYLIEMDIATQK